MAGELLVEGVVVVVQVVVQVHLLVRRVSWVFFLLQALYREEVVQRLRRALVWNWNGGFYRGGSYRGGSYRGGTYHGIHWIRGVDPSAF